MLAATIVLVRTASAPQGDDKARSAQSPTGARTAAPVDRSTLVRFHSPTFGAADAKVELVEFFDPACGSCRAVYPFVKEIMEANPGRIRLIVRYAPFHKGADDVVMLLEAARRQGKYRETLERLLAHQSDWVINHTARPDLAFKAIAGLGLDTRRLEEDMRAPQVRQLIEQDLRDAVALNVTGTPEFFINGKPLVPRSFDDLRSHIEQELRAAYR